MTIPKGTKEEFLADIGNGDLFTPAVDLYIHSAYGKISVRVEGLPNRPKLMYLVTTYKDDRVTRDDFDTIDAAAEFFFNGVDTRRGKRKS